MSDEATEAARVAVKLMMLVCDNATSVRYDPDDLTVPARVNVREAVELIAAWHLVQVAQARAEGAQGALTKVRAAADDKSGMDNLLNAAAEALMVRWEHPRDLSRGSVLIDGEDPRWVVKIVLDALLAEVDRG